MNDSGIACLKFYTLPARKHTDYLGIFHLIYIINTHKFSQHIIIEDFTDLQIPQRVTPTIFGVLSFYHFLRRYIAVKIRRIVDSPQLIVCSLILLI